MAPNHVSMCQPLLWLEPQRPRVPSRGHKNANHCRLWARLLASVALIHFLVGFDSAVALSIALDAQSVAGQIGVTCRGASLKVRRCRLPRARQARRRARRAAPERQPSACLARAPLYPSRAPLPGTPLGQPSRASNTCSLRRDQRTDPSSADTPGTPVTRTHHGCHA